MLNPQRTLERGYAVILSQENNEMHAVRRPEELVAEKVFQIQLAEGGAEVGFSTVKINRQ
jgi:exodeoxyribonuclease VII large subunit